MHLSARLIGVLVGSVATSAFAAPTIETSTSTDRSVGILVKKTLGTNYKTSGSGIVIPNKYALETSKNSLGIEDMRENFGVVIVGDLPKDAHRDADNKFVANLVGEDGEANVGFLEKFLGEFESQIKNALEKNPLTNLKAYILGPYVDRSHAQKFTDEEIKVNELGHAISNWITEITSKVVYSTYKPKKLLGMVKNKVELLCEKDNTVILSGASR
ncbi:Uu.00g144590.m01.CDS01 [Anthostomella pinea]|uniref:Uu.00g144590.m01.CDS01 n=1 Tax=Anthostomella pinea TaxID=933095 RepID=A0AAI8VRS6_9PEZI|nr:Uu.00g144590.m01.CDS01 [Anthostomella pinea]